MTNVLNDTFIVRYDEALRSIVIVHPDKEVTATPLIRIRAETLDRMNFSQASQFLGERLLLLMPELRKRYAEDISKLSRGE